MVQRGGERHDGRGVDRVFESFAAPDPRLQLMLLFVHFDSSIRCIKRQQLLSEVCDRGYVK